MTIVRRRRPALALAFVSALLLLAGCSSGTAEAEPTPAVDDTDEAGDAPARQGSVGDLGGNGISGLIAAVSDSLMQVQSTDSQTGVTWTDETVITQTVPVGLDAITVGSCVVAVAPAAEEGSTATTAATTIAVSDPVDGGCAAGFGALPGAGGAATGEMPGDFEPPEGMEFPEDGELPEGLELPEGFELPGDGERPEGMGGRGGAFGQMIIGSVTAVSGSTVTIETTDMDGAMTTRTLETDTDSVVTTTVTADATAIAVGLCASVRGETDTRGGMTAATIALSDPGENGCTAGMGARLTNRAGDE